MRATDERRGVVTAIEDGLVYLVEDRTTDQFDVPLAAPGGVRPLPGDYWLCTRALTGYWALDRLITSRRTADRPQRSFREVVQRLTGRGLVDMSPLDSDSPEAPHLAHIGQVRWFPFVPDPHFWPAADGSALNRVQYPELAAVLDPTGTSETFTIPFVQPTSAIEAPQVPVYQNAWEDYTTGGFTSLRYWREGRHLIISGMTLNPGATGTTSVVFNLPVGYRPLTHHVFDAYGNNGGTTRAYRVTVRSNGNVDVAEAAAVDYSYLSMEIRVLLASDADAYYTARPYLCAR